jgi:hypothetical protein
MNFFAIFGIFVIFSIGSISINSVSAQIDPLSEIIFFQSGELHTEKNHFLISDKFDIREFFNGKIIRVSGQSIEGFPYITYSKIINDQINTFGKIFINGEFVELSFIEKGIIIEDTETKNDDLEIVTQYTQRVHSKQVVFIGVKIFENEQNKYIDFNQNYGLISNTNIQVKITNEENQEVFSSNGVTNDFGLFETEYLIPDNSRIETLTIRINAENNNSSSSKILQIFTLGNISNNG